MSKRKIGWGQLLLIALFCLYCNASNASAETPQSNNYRLYESNVGTGTINESSSSSYKTDSATGNLIVGNSASGHYQIDSGTKTTPDPSLSFAFTNSNVNFGSFSATNATVATASFSVVNYTSYGYVIQIAGNPPTNGSHTIAAMPTADSSQIGIEQFGINLVANTSPASIGANPNNGQFGFGTIATNYSTANKYRYVSGETIASSSKSSGETIYTISYLVNVSSITPGGKYNSDQTIIITGTY